MDTPFFERPIGTPILVTLAAISTSISVYHIVHHDAPLLPTLLGQWFPFVASLGFGTLGWYCVRQVETSRQRNLIGVHALLLYLLGGLASLVYGIHEFLSPEVGMPIEGLLFESLFVALLAGMSGTLTGLEVARREGTLNDLEAERDRFSQLFENIPEPAAEYALDEGEITLTRGNSSFVEQFGVELPISMAAFNETVAGLASDVEPAALDRTLVERDQVTAEIVRETGSGRRWFKLRSAPHGDGGFLLYFDITEKHLQEQQVRVLSRVLRHNLQNNLSVAHGYARLIEQRADSDQLKTNAEKICSAVEELLEIAERTKTIRDHLEENPPKPERTEITGIIEDRVAAARESFTDVEFALACPNELWAEAHPTLGIVLDALFDTLVDHNDRPQPVISVRVETDSTEDGGIAVIRISDNGRGLPEQELIPLRTGKEPSQLEHATDVDLWLATWFIDKFGGVLDAETSDAGTTFEIKLVADVGDESNPEREHVNAGRIPH